MAKVKIIDKPCGTGKTTELMASFEQNKKYLVIVPFLSEVDRIIGGVSKLIPFHTPTVSTSTPTKLESLRDLATRGVNIVATHALYKSLETVVDSGLLADYHLIVDEVPTVCSLVYTLAERSAADIYIGNNYIEVDQNSVVTTTAKWAKDNESLKDTLSHSLFRKINNKCLFLVEGRHFLEAMPKKLLLIGKSTKFYTYKAEGSLLCKYLEKLQIPYSIESSKQEEIEFVNRARALIEIVDISKGLEAIPFSYSKQISGLSDASYVKRVQNQLKNLKQRELAGVPSDEIMLTCTKDAWSKKSANGGFITNSRMSKVQWVANQTRGTNQYSHCSNAIYLYSQNVNPLFCRWLGITNDSRFKDKYALTELIQWVYRSRVRRGQPIKLFIPCLRMRSLFKAWLNGHFESFNMVA